jgi:hypothetical protein
MLIHYHAADVWSCGVILYVLLAGFLPFDESTIVALFAKIQSADFTYPSWFSAEARSLIDQMLVADPKARLSIAQIRTHPWFLGPTGAAPESAAPAPPSTTPSAAEMENAVKEETLGEDWDDGDYPKGLTQPVTLNAFDLVSQCGGFLLDKTFRPEIFYAAPADEALPKPSRSSSGQSVQAGTVSGVRRKCFHFTASNISAHDLAAAGYDALQDMGCDFDTPRETCLQTGVIRASLLSAKGMVGVGLQVFVLTPSLCLVEVKRGKGDIMEWSTAYAELIDRRLAHLLNKPKRPDEDVKEYY